MTSVEPRLSDAEVGECPETLPAIASPEAQALAIAELTDRARSYARSSKAANTLRAYESDVRFRAWCAQAGLEALAATGETVALYLTAYAGVSRSKTDQEGEGHTVGITYGSNPPTCPVRAWRAWAGAAELETGRHSAAGA